MWILMAGQMRFFLTNSQRREMIRGNLSNLKVLDAAFVFSEGLDVSTFNKFYLFSTPSFDNSLFFPKKLVRRLSGEMSVSSLIYITAQFRIPFWWFDLIIDKEKTKSALSFESSGKWHPFVLKKIF